MLISDLPDVPNPITGQEFIALMQNGKTCRSTLSTAYSGNISVTSSVLPAGGNGIYLPSSNTVGVAANGATGFAVTNPAKAVDYLQASGSSTAAPVAYVSLSALGSDTAIGINYRSKGTTTSGSQFNGQVTSTTGTQNFYINGAQVLQLTDTYWNPNVSYQGAPTAWPVISSGALAGGPDNICVISCDSSLYPGTATGVTLLHGAKGLTGSHHFMNNGLVGHVSIGTPSNTAGIDKYAVPNALWLQGSQAGSTTDCLIFTNYGNTDSTIGMTFYNEGTGGYTFLSDNTASTICKMNRVANAVNAVQIYGAASGNNPTIGTTLGTVRLTLAGSDTAGVDICNGAQYTGTAACAPIARFNGVFESTNYFQFTAGTTATLTTNGGDLLLQGGSGFIAFGTYTAVPATSAGYITIHDSTGAARKLMIGT